MRRNNFEPLLTAVLAVVALLAIATDVTAHARIKRANPAIGGTVASSAVPAELQVWFSEALEPALSAMEVFNHDGTRVDGGDARVDPDDHAMMRVSMRPLTPGQYRVNWRVVSTDTHFTSGSFPFRVDP
jgi:copper resistance protein C